ncbi:lebercilin isoform X1 [Brachionus plicatilis]|uniref:Lebercilin isoform X1 n=1 Tax=Brachionus plicatilis TaxID=10195 RepID=A0A3M7T0G1_BRAPC|nr:lebercilin isoform X1 [Brachionus plicatilis]
MNRESRRYSSPSESVSRSSTRSRSESRSRGRTATQSRSTRTRTRSSSPQSPRSSSHTSKNYNTYSKSQAPKTVPQAIRISKASSESSVNRKRPNVVQRRTGARNLPPRQQPRPQTEQISQTAMRVMSAQRLKNNDLNNRLKELMKEMEKLREENKMLTRVHKREERALKNLENQEHDVGRMVRNHLDETNVLKEQIKKIKGENKKLTTTLIEKDEEIRAMKKKNDEMKKLLVDKKLFDNAELSKRLETSERDLANYKSKYEET